MHKSEVTVLTGIETTEVSLVDRPAIGYGFSIIKNESGEIPSEEEVKAMLDTNETASVDETIADNVVTQEAETETVEIVSEAVETNVEDAVVEQAEAEVETVANASITVEDVKLLLSDFMSQITGYIDSKLTNLPESFSASLSPKFEEILSLRKADISEKVVEDKVDEEINKNDNEKAVEVELAKRAGSDTITRKGTINSNTENANTESTPAKDFSKGLINSESTIHTRDSIRSVLKRSISL